MEEAEEYLVPRLRPHDARELVVCAQKSAHDLSGAQRRTGGRTHSGSADLGPSRPGPGVNVGIECVVDRNHAADQLSGRLGGATGIFVYGPELPAVGIPPANRPSPAIKKSAVDP